MMYRFVIALVTILPLGGCAALAQGQATPSVDQQQTTEQINQRFQHMEEMMGQARNVQGDQRRARMQEHMALMSEQIQAMHGMMGQGGMMQRQGADDEPAPQAQQMQQRMDMMQQMMENMIEHHEMMMGSMTQ